VKETFAMLLVIIGVLLIALKLAGVGFLADLSWWWVAVPFGLAVLWWEFADSSGWTMRRAMDKMEKRKIERRDRHMEALGLKIGGQRRDRLATKHTEIKAREVSADPMHAGRGAAPKVVARSEIEQRREPRI
jgi:small Trp-rich protein